MTDSTSPFTTNVPLLVADRDQPLPAGLTIHMLTKPAAGDEYAKVIYSLPGSPQHHHTCHVTMFIYNTLRHEQNRQ